MVPWLESRFGAGRNVERKAKWASPCDPADRTASNALESVGHEIRGGRSRYIAADVLGAVRDNSTTHSEPRLTRKLPLLKTLPPRVGRDHRGKFFGSIWFAMCCRIILRRKDVSCDVTATTTAYLMPDRLEAFERFRSAGSHGEAHLAFARHSSRHRIWTLTREPLTSARKTGRTSLQVKIRVQKPGIAQAWGLENSGSTYGKTLGRGMVLSPRALVR